MSEDSPFLPEETNQQATPLDLLLNAITGSSSNYPYTQQTDGGEGLEALGGLLQTNRVSEHKQAHESRKRPRDDQSASPRRGKLTRTLHDHVHLTASRAHDPSASPDLFSSIEVWHPRTGQKSYQKERRILNPPPTLRVKGPLLSLLTTVTLSSTTVPLIPTVACLHLSSQTHHIPLLPTVKARLPPINKKEEREEEVKKMRQTALLSGFGASLPWERRRRIAREREALSDGLTFPGLWIAEEVGKAKEFQLELTLGQPGVEATVPIETDPNFPIRKAPAVDPPLELEEGRPSGGVDSQNPLDPTLDPLLQMEQPERDAEPSSLSGANLTSADLTGMVGDDGGNFVVENEAHPFDQHLPPASQTLSFLEDPDQNAPTVPEEQQPWARLLSAPLSIVSKPSKRTAKARSMASCLTVHDSVALTIRINSQAVRTKYMKLAAGPTPQLTSRTGKWSPFRLDVIRRAALPDTRERESTRVAQIPETSDILTYGSIVQIVGVQDGTRSEPVRLAKIDKNEMIVGDDAGQPVSELQRVGFVRLDPDLNDWGHSERWYLSAPGARAGGGELLEPREVEVKTNPGQGGQSASTALPLSESMTIDPSATEDAAPETLGDLANTASDLIGGSGDPVDLGLAVSDAEAVKVKKRRKTRRNALAMATLAEEDENATDSLLRWQSAVRQNKEVTVGDAKARRTKMAEVDTVEDWMCWVITGVSCFTYSFFDGMNHNQPLPDISLGTAPRILADPIFYPESNTLDFLISEPDESSLDFYVGSIGPLQYSIWRSGVPPGGLKHTAVEYPAIRLDDGGETVNGRRITSSWPANQRHALLVLEVPHVEEIVEAMRDKAIKSESRAVETSQIDGNPFQPELEASGTNWLEGEAQDQATATGELTIQEAIRNAEDALQSEMNLEQTEGAVGEDPLRSAGLVELSGEAIGGQQTGNDIPDQAIVLTTRSSDSGYSSAQLNLPSLPLLMIRRRDGVVFSSGRNIAAVRLDEGRELDRGHWGLQLVPA